MSIKKTAKVLAYYGIEIYDIIIYTGLLLSNMNKKVLLIDNSKNKALSLCISIPRNLDEKNEIVEYKGIDFLLNKNFLKYLKDYDYIFINYGFTDIGFDFTFINEIIYITDMQFHNIKRIFNNNKHNQSSNIHLIIRDLCKKESVKKIIEMFFDKEIDISSYYLLEDDYQDRKRRSSLQFSKRTNYKLLSYSIQGLIESLLIKTLLVDKEEFNLAYKKMKRGA